MPTIFQLDSMNIATGASREISIDEGCPLGWTRAEIPVVALGQFVRVDGAEVTVLDAYPTPALNLPALKAAKNAEINAARLAITYSTFTHSGKVFSCDQLSRSDIDGINGYVALNSALPAAWPGAWKAVDNSFLPIPDVAAWTAFYTAMVNTGNDNFAHSQALKATLAAATSADEVAAIGW